MSYGTHYGPCNHSGGIGVGMNFHACLRHLSLKEGMILWGFSNCLFSYSFCLDTNWKNRLQKESKIQPTWLNQEFSNCQDACLINTYRIGALQRCSNYINLATTSLATMQKHAKHIITMVHVPPNLRDV